MKCSYFQRATNQNAVTSCTYKLSGDAWQAVQDLEDVKLNEMKANNVPYNSNDQVNKQNRFLFKISS